MHIKQSLFHPTNQPHTYIHLIDAWQFTVKCEWKRYNKKRLVQKTASGSASKSTIAIDGAEFELNTDNDCTDVCRTSEPKQVE
jgi:hypothetical protein